jgi:lipoprotein-releasing system permease protein
MGYPLTLAIRYLSSKKRAFISVGTMFAILGVALGVAALVTVMSVTGGFQAQFREKVLGVNAHVLVLKYTTDFPEYRDVMEEVSEIPGVIGVAPFSINPMMLTHGAVSATGVLVKGVDPEKSLGAGDAPGITPVLDLPQHLIAGDFEGLRLPDSRPAEKKKPSLPPIPLPLPTGSAAEVAQPGDEELPSGNKPLLRELKKQVEDVELPGDDADIDDILPKTVFDPDALETEPGGDTEEAPSDEDFLPEGSVVPEGGYESVLPDVDVLPDDVETDLCDDPEAVKALPGIVVGVSLADSLDLEIDDCVLVTSPTIGMSFSGGEVKPPVAKRFRVIAIFEAGFEQYDSKLVYTDLYEAQDFYDYGDVVTGVEMKIDDIDRATEIAAQVDATLGEGLYHTIDWQQLNHGLFTALKIQQVGMSAVLALIIVVAAFTVIATLIMVVLDKKKEIAVLKAMGANDEAILRTFLYQGGIIGLAGTGLGLLIGFVVCKGLIAYAFPLDPKVYFISRLPVLVRPQEFLITGGVALLICLAATIVPSLYAASLRPAEGFRDG